MFPEDADHLRIADKARESLMLPAYSFAHLTEMLNLTQNAMRGLLKFPWSVVVGNFILAEHGLVC